MTSPITTMDQVASANPVLPQEPQTQTKGELNGKSVTNDTAHVNKLRADLQGEIPVARNTNNYGPIGIALLINVLSRVALAFPPTFAIGATLFFLYWSMGGIFGGGSNSKIDDSKNEEAQERVRQAHNEKLIHWANEQHIRLSRENLSKVNELYERARAKERVKALPKVQTDLHPLIASRSM